MNSTIATLLNGTTNWITDAVDTMANNTEQDYPPGDTDDYHSDFLETDGYWPQIELDLEYIDYIYGPTITFFAIISSFLIVFTFLRPTMISPTTILLSGIVVCQTLFAVTIYGNYLYIYFTYGTKGIFLFYPGCIINFAGKTTGNVASDMAYMLIACVAIQRILVVRFPIKSRIVLTNTVSGIMVLGSFLISVAYNIPYIYFYGNFITLRDFVTVMGKDDSLYQEYYYYYYYYYYDTSEQVSSHSTNPSDNMSTTPNIIPVEENSMYCMAYRDPTFDRFYRFYNPIFSLIPFTVLSFSTFYLIKAVKNRGKSDEIHESGSRLQRIRNMTRCIMIFLMVELVKKLFNLFFNISGIITILGYDVFDLMGYENISKITKVWEILSCGGSIVNFWIYIFASEQFRKEMIATFTCVFCRNMLQQYRKSTVFVAAPKTTSSHLKQPPSEQ